MRLSISNIGWPSELDSQIVPLLRAHGMTAIEVAPSRLWPNWGTGLVEAAAHYRDGLISRGLGCSSVQAILYGRPDLRVFGSNAQRQALINHLRLVTDIAEALGATPMVFGAPANRDKGTLDDRSAFTAAVEVFAVAGEYCAGKSVHLCIEPNPVEYGCNFVTTAEEGARLVRAVGSPGFRLHLDTAAMHLAGEDPVRVISESADVLAHVHVSEPYLEAFSEPRVDHRRVANALRKIGWNRWLSIEMRAGPRPVEAVREALAQVTELYGIS